MTVLSEYDSKPLNSSRYFLVTFCRDACLLCNFLIVIKIASNSSHGQEANKVDGLLLPAINNNTILFIIYKKK
jgi:hypothetical protein